MFKKSSLAACASAFAASTLLGVVSSAIAGEEFNLGNRPWDFTAQNRAGIAALIEQKANGTIGGGGNGSGGGGCGGNAGNSTAIGNYTCIIINDSTSVLELVQKEFGDQTANTQTQNSGGSMSDVLQELNN